MSAYDAYKKRKAEKEEKKPAVNSAYEAYKQNKEQNAFSTVEFSSVGSLKHWVSAANNLTVELEDFYNGNYERWDSQFGSSYDGKIDSALESGNAALKYLKENQNDISNYEELRDGIQSYVDAFNTAKNRFSSTREYYSQWESEDDYNKGKVDWLNTEGETTAEKVAGRKDIYLSNEARISEIDKEIQELGYMPKYATTADGIPLPFKINDGSDKKKKYDALIAEKEKLQAENRQYDRTQGEMDKYYDFTLQSDFKEDSSKRDFTNPTEEDLNKKDVALDSSQWYWKDGKLYDALGNEIDPTNTDSKGNIIHPWADSAEVSDKLGLFLNTSEEDKQGAYADVAADGESSWAAAIKDGRDGSWDQLEEDEIKIYYYLLNTEGQESAYKYLDDMKTELNRRSMEAMTKEIDEANGLEKLALNVAAIPARIYGGAVAAVEDAAHLIQGEGINPYSNAHLLSNFGQSVMSETEKDIIQATGGAEIPLLKRNFGEIYSDVMQGVDSIVGAVTMGKAYMPFMVTGAASNMATDLYNRGASNGQIAAGSILAGAAEYLGEKIGLDHMLDMIGGKTSGKFLVELAKQMGIEYGEEWFTEGLNIMSDALVMQSQSDLRLMVDNYKAEGLTDGQAFWEATKESLGRMHDAGVSGAIGAIVGGGVAGAVGQANRNAAYRKEGQQILDNDGYNALKALALDVAGASKGADAKAVGKFVKVADKKTSAKNVGKLSDAVETLRTNQNLSDLTSELKSAGLSSKEAKQVAQYMDDAADGKALSEADEQNFARIAEENEAVRKVYTNLFGENGASHAVTKRNEQHSLGRKGVVVDEDGVFATENTPEPIRKALEGNSLSETKMTSADDLSLSEDGVTRVASTGAEVSIQGAKTVEVENENGEKGIAYQFKVVDSEGNESYVDHSDIEYKSDSEGLMYEAFVDLGIDPAYFDSYVANFNKADFDVKPGDIPAEWQYAAGFNEAVNFGKAGLEGGYKTLTGDGKSTVSSSYLENGEFTRGLKENVRNLAYNLGKTASEERLESEAKAIDKAVQERKESGKGKVKEKGRFHYEQKTDEVLNKHQRAGLLAAKRLTELGNDVYIFRSTEDADGNRIDDRGEICPNGFYRGKDGSIHIDLYAGENGNGLMVYTIAHELLHNGRRYAQREFKTFKKLLYEWYGEQYDPKHHGSIDKLIKQRMKDEGVSWDVAEEEVLADFCEPFLADGNIEERVAQLKATDEETFNFVQKIIQKIWNLVKSIYSKVNPDSTEGQFSREHKDSLERVYDAFAKMTYAASENLQWTGGMELHTAEVSVSENGVIQMQQRHYNQKNAVTGMSGRDTLLDYLENRYGKEDAASLIKTIDSINTVMDEIKADHPELQIFSQWQDTEIEIDADGKPIFTTSIKNGDYELNQDFSRVCKKRRQLDFVLNLLAEDPNFEAKYLTKKDFVEINNAIKKHGFEIACALCFVDSKRFRQAEWADSFANTWNDILESVMVKGSKPTPFNFATKKANVADEGIEIDLTKPITLRKWSDGKVSETRHYDNLEHLLSKTMKNGKEAYVEGNNNIRTIAALIRDNPSLRHTFRGADIISSTGFDAIQRLAPGVRNILDGWGGSSVPKPSSMDASYDNSILNIKGYNAETAFAMGGVRMNSFSDFMAHMFFDYCEAFADLSAKSLPMQSYTKELIFARLFGKSGGKINMSGIAAIRENTLPMKENKKAGITKAQAEKNIKIEKMLAGLDVSRLTEHLQKDVSELTESDLEEFLDMCDYLWADESINMTQATLLQSGILYDKLSESKQAECYELLKQGKFDEAFKVAGKENVDKEYAKHIGTIVVGVSDAHIRKLLRDPTIRMVIPYHKSSLNPQIAQLLKIAVYNDYTDVQSTGVLVKGAPKRVNLSSTAIQDSLGLVDFSFYDYFGKTIDGVTYDGRETANKYLEWCEKGVYDEKVGDYVYYTKKGDGYILAKKLHERYTIVPKFDAFKGEINYYKVLEDFDCYDTITGEHSPQEAVQFLQNGLPSDYKGILTTALKEEQGLAEDFRDHLDNQGLKDEIMGIVKKNGYEATEGIGIGRKVSDEARELSDADVKFSVRKSDPPKNTIKGYKVFFVKNGKLYPPMVANPNGEGTPRGVWLDADDGELARNKDGSVKTNSFGRPRVKAGGKGTQGGSGDLAYRPGWHLGDLPMAKQFARKDADGNKTLFPAAFVWAECDVAADVEYQAEADAMGYKFSKNGKFNHQQASLDHMPREEDGTAGFYRYRTNPDPTTEAWIITGAMKVNRLLTDAEVNAILEENGRTPMPRQGGELDLEKLGLTEADFADNSDDTKKSTRKKASTFYSKMEQIIGDIKPQKMGAGGVVPYLKGKGVKNEEIKWSGIEAFLEGKKSVTKEELQEFAAGSQLEITERTLSDKELPYTEDQKKRMSEYTEKRDAVAKKLSDEWKRIVGEEIPIRNFGAGVDSDVAHRIVEINAEYKKSTFEGRLLKKLRADVLKVIERNDDFGFDSPKLALISIHRNRKDFAKNQDMPSADKAVIVKYCNALNAYNELPGKISDADEDILRGLAEEAHGFSVRIHEVKMENYAEVSRYKPRWQQYSLNGGDNYREILFYMPNSSYYNDSMTAHWGVNERGVLAHARIQDFDTAAGRMLFIEEIQSDWHNAGHKDGYENEEATFEVRHESHDMLNEPIVRLYRNGRPTTHFLYENESGEVYDSNLDEWVPKSDSMWLEELSKYYNSDGNAVPNAPFRDTYHEYVLKRLIRIAAEEGYDSIGWTPAEIQDERWTDNREHEEGKGVSGNLVGYTIEYDQDIPKFLRKYGKKWGATVETTTLDNGTEVWSMAIPDSMKESVLYEGQVKFSRRGVNKHGIEVYETSDEVKKLSYKERMKAFESIMEDQYKGRTAKFVRNGHVYYALFDRADVKKNIYGDKRTDSPGWKAKINVGADGDIFELVENSRYNGSKPEKGKKIASHTGVGYWDYFIKTVQIDDKVFDLVANIRKKPDNSFVYSIRLTENKKIEASPPLDSLLRALSGVPNASGNTIAQIDGNVKPQIRKSGTSARSLLANALETVAQNDIERNKLAQYKEKIDLLNEEEEKLRKLNEELRRLSFPEKGTKRDQKRITELRFEANHTLARINTLDKSLFDLEASAPLKKVLQREKDAIRKKYEREGKEQTKQKVREKAESISKKIAKKDLEKLVVDTARWLTNPKKDEVKCPDVIRVPFAEFLDSIDMSSKRLLRGGEATQNDLRIAAAMDSLATAVEKIRNAQDPSSETSSDGLDAGYLDLPTDFVENIRLMSESIKRLMKISDTGYDILQEMSSEEMKLLTHVIKTLKKAVRDMQRLYTNYRYANAVTLGQNTMTFVDALGEDSGKALGFRGFYAWQNAVPYYAFKRFGDAGESIFESFMDAQDKQAFLSDEILKFADETWTTKEVKEWSEDVHDILLPSGATLTLTTADAMNLYCLARRQHAGGHLVGYGVRVKGIKKGGKKLSDSIAAFSEEDVDEIIKTKGKVLKLTERQVDVAEAMQKFMSTTCAEWGNEISMKRFLTKMFTEKHYVPIESDPEGMDTKDPEAKKSDLFRLLNISATKPLTENANNRIIVRNLFDVFTEHATDMARLNAWGMALLDYMKWMNYREKHQSPTGEKKQVGVRESIRTAYSDHATGYLLNFIKDVNGVGDGGRKIGFIEKTFSHAKTAAVGANLRVAALQLTAYPRAALVLSPKSLAAGAAKLKPSIAKAKKYCGIALWKSFGYYDTDVSRSMEAQIKGDTSVMDKVKDVSMWLAGKADEVTWGYLWNACEAEVAKTGQYTKGTEEFNIAVGKKLREVVYSSQVVDSVLTRSELMRSKNSFAKMASSFMSEPTMTHNITLDCMMKFSIAKRQTGFAEAALAKTWKHSARSISTVMATTLLVALVGGLANALRDDDDEPFDEKFKDEFIGSLLEELIPLSRLPLASDITGLIASKLGVGYFSSSNLATDYLTTISNAYDAWADIFNNGEDAQKTVYYALFNTVKGISQFTGVPGSNAMREVVTLWNNTVGAADYSMKIRTYEPSDSANAESLYQAIVSGDAKWQSKMENLWVDETERQKDLKKVIGDHYAAGDIDYDTAKDYLEEYCGMEDDDIHWQLDRWQYTAENGSSEGYSKYDDFFTAVETGKNLKAVIQQYTTKGVEKKTLASQITSHFKPLYKEMSNYERANLKGYLLNAYSVLGYDRSKKSKDIDKWLED